MGYKRGLDKFRPLPAPREVVDTIAEECSRCHGRIEPGERRYLRWEAWPSGRVQRVEHLGCAAKERAS